MTDYSTSEVSDLLGLKPHQIRRCVRNALVSPQRGARGEYRFHFQDVVLLRTVKQLLESQVSSRRAVRGLLKVRSRLPATGALSGARVFAHGKAVMVQEGPRLWDVESGQAWLDFRQDDAVCQIVMLDCDPLVVLREVEACDSDFWYNLGIDLEEVDPVRAPEAYERAIQLDERNTDAHVNLGRLRQLAGDLPAAQALYQRALEVQPGHQLAVYNLGTVYDELGQVEHALEFYRRAGSIPDAHFNLARISESRGDELSARRHIREYRRLMIR